MWVPHKELKKKIKKEEIERDGERRREKWEGEFFFFFLFITFILRFSSFRPSDFVGINTESALRDEGYA